MRRAGVAAASAAVLALAACGHDPFGTPVRVKTHGYRAHATLKEAGAVKSEWEIAVRGDDLRRAPAAGNAAHVLIWRGGEKKLLELDTATRTYWERPGGSPDAILPGHPLAPGFRQTDEAFRRGIENYHRESDTVFAGHVCWIWRFDDKPGDDKSPSTSYWVAPDLDSIVLRVVRERVGLQGVETVSSSDLTDVRVSADPLLFTTQDFKKTDAPR